MTSFVPRVLVLLSSTSIKLIFVFVRTLLPVDAMPVSHLGLSVSNISSATSFYLSALQPLGYRYIGHQGDSIGLGINDADFFLCQTKNGYAFHNILGYNND